MSRLKLITIICSILLLITLTGCGDKHKEEPITNTDFLIKVFSEGSQTDANYKIVGEGIIKEGTTADGGFTKINLPSNTTYNLYIDKKGYYSNISQHWIPKNSKTITEEFSLTKYGSLELSQNGSLISDGKTEITIKSTGESKRLSICYRKSNRITSVEFPEFYVEGDFTNCSKLNPNPKFKEDPCQEYYPFETYLEQESGEIYYCENVEGNKCIPSNMNVPKRLRTQRLDFSTVDKCIPTGLTLNNEEYTFEISAKTWNPTIDDYLKIYVIDSIRSKNTGYRYVYEVNGEDVGIEDVYFEIR